MAFARGSAAPSVKRPNSCIFCCSSSSISSICCWVCTASRIRLCFAAVVFSASSEFSCAPSLTISCSSRAIRTALSSELLCREDTEDVESRRLAAPPFRRSTDPGVRCACSPISVLRTFFFLQAAGMMAVRRTTSPLSPSHWSSKRTRTVVMLLNSFTSPNCPARACSTSSTQILVPSSRPSCGTAPSAPVALTAAVLLPHRALAELRRPGDAGALLLGRSRAGSPSPSSSLLACPSDVARASSCPTTASFERPSISLRLSLTQRAVGTISMPSRRDVVTSPSHL